MCQNSCTKCECGDHFLWFSCRKVSIACVTTIKKQTLPLSLIQLNIILRHLNQDIRTDAVSGLRVCVCSGQNRLSQPFIMVYKVTVKLCNTEIEIQNVFFYFLN